jgi:thiamine pyrophosphate-dependent acetolactate synthase large subunit-like protein
LRRAKRPVIIVGHGSRFQMAAVIELAEMLDCPVITTFKGKGLISDHHPLGCGVLGRSGTPIASWFMNEADCLLVLGASFSTHTGITAKKPTIQVDYDPMILGKFHAVDVPVWGEIGVTARLLRQRLNGKSSATSQRDEIADRWAIWREEKARRRQETSDKGLSSAILFDALERHVPADAILAADVGNNTYSFGRYFECRRQAVLMSGYLGSIGFGFPAAMGAWAATQEEGTPFLGRKVVSISGDGGFAQYMAELTTAVKYGMNITHVLLNNMELGKISKEQRSADLEVWQTDLWNPHFGLWARNCGAMGVRVTNLDELDDALARAMSHAGPSLVEVMTDPGLI